MTGYVSGMVFSYLLQGFEISDLFLQDFLLAKNGENLSPDLGWRKRNIFPRAFVKIKSKLQGWTLNSVCWFYILRRYVTLALRHWSAYEIFINLVCIYSPYFHLHNTQTIELIIRVRWGMFASKIRNWNPALTFVWTYKLWQS